MICSQEEHIIPLRIDLFQKWAFWLQLSSLIWKILSLQILRNKFDEFKRQVEASQERFNRCERMAKWLVEDKGPYTKDVLQRQDQLG